MSTFDISKYQGVVSVATFQTARALGYERVILKLGGGDSGRYEDSCYQANHANAAAAGLIVEGYWFNGTTDVAGDARFAAQLAGPGVRIWWDAENEGSMPHWTPAQVNLAGRTVQATNPSGAYMSSSVTFEADWSPCTWMPLWVANYDASAPPAVGHWGGEVLWQNTSKGHIPGIPGYVDLDQEVGALAASTATPITLEAIMALKDSIQFFTNPTRGVFLAGPAAWLPIDNRDGVNGQRKIDLLNKYVGAIPTTVVQDVGDWDALNQTFKDWALASAAGK